MQDRQRPGRGALDVVVDALAFVAAFLLCALTVLVCLDVAARYLRLFSLPWIFDFTEYALYLITFASAPWILRDGGHISVDLVTQALGERARRGLTIVTKLVGATTCSVLTYLFCRTLWRSYTERTMVHDTFVFAEWLLFILPAPVFLIMLMLFLRDLGAGRPAPGRKDGL